jgi:protein gp37
LSARKALHPTRRSAGRYKALPLPWPRFATPPDARDETLIRARPDVDWLLLTKRIGNAAAMSEATRGLPANVWLGATVVDQAQADRDISQLDVASDLVTIRFFSIEPLLGPITTPWDWLYGTGSRNGIDWVMVGGESEPRPADATRVGPRASQSMRRGGCADAV